MIGFKIFHSEKPLDLIIVISLLEERKKKAIIAENKINEGTTSFKKSGICRNAIKKV